jgi:hypothetical protein
VAESISVAGLESRDRKIDVPYMKPNFVCVGVTSCEADSAQSSH